ncbi:UPF0454 protein C12orf49 [Liparis tanakae]|uniref:UPF0454 protein C12orf49 n=1 Tax=Liparis tanakae TaxID=230148 RepID=A0A4Z2ELQ1_9TELE|nr:UPF0454 protein C12orf49 [Liparis tanakae]
MKVLRRLLRRRWVLGVVFGLSLIYFLTSTLKQVGLTWARRYDPQVGLTWAHRYDPQVHGYDPQVHGYDPQVHRYDPQVHGYDPQSVQHENTYRNPRAKHCYGESPPELLPV